MPPFDRPPFLNSEETKKIGTGLSCRDSILNKQRPDFDSLCMGDIQKLKSKTCVSFVFVFVESLFSIHIVNLKKIIDT